MSATHLFPHPAANQNGFRQLSRQVLSQYWLYVVSVIPAASPGKDWYKQHRGDFSKSWGQSQILQGDFCRFAPSSLGCYNPVVFYVD